MIGFVLPINYMDIEVVVYIFDNESLIESIFFFCFGLLMDHILYMFAKDTILKVLLLDYIV